LTVANGEEREAKLDPAVLRVLAVVLLGPFMSQIDSTVVNVSLSAIRDDLHSSTESASDEQSAVRRPFDLLGFLLISPGLVALLYGLEQATHGRGFGPLALGAALLAGFVVHAKRVRSSALIDLQLFESGLFANAAVSQFLANGMLYASQFLVPLYLITGAGLTPGRVGWLLAPPGVAMVFIYPMMGAITDRFGCRAVVASGVVLTVVGTLPFLWMTQRGLTTAGVEIGLFLRSAGQGAIGIPTISAAYASVPKEKLSFATTAVNIVQRIGGPVATIAIAITVTLATARGAGGSAFLMPFLALMSIQLLALGCAMRLPARIGDAR
jgi:hypothetical protein